MPGPTFCLRGKQVAYHRIWLNDSQHWLVSCTGKHPIESNGNQFPKLWHACFILMNIMPLMMKWIDRLGVFSHGFWYCYRGIQESVLNICFDRILQQYFILHFMYTHLFTSSVFLFLVDIQNNLGINVFDEQTILHIQFSQTSFLEKWLFLLKISKLGIVVNS